MRIQSDNLMRLIAVMEQERLRGRHTIIIPAVVEFGDSDLSPVIEG